MKKICVIGSLNMDLVVNVDDMPKKGQTLIGSSFKEVPGGKGANQAVAIARLGADITMIGKVGNDSFGKTLINQLKTDNVKTDYVHIEEGSSGVAMITVDKNAENYEERKRRKQFYLANGMTPMNVLVELFGVDMELLGFDCQISFEEYHDFYRDNYNAWAAEHVKPMPVAEFAEKYPE